jgi:chromosome segregation ATPase
MLMIMPAIWRRAVRLTKKRIEAATPITLAEFRADKDQLRAEFALEKRKLEITIEQLRNRLSAQLGDVSTKSSDLATLRIEREAQAANMAALEARENELRRRVLELEREGTALADQLRAKDEEIEARATELVAAREALRQKMPPALLAEGKELTGDYEEDVDELLTALAVERKRSSVLEDRVKELLGELERSDQRTGEIGAAMAELKRTLARKEGEDGGAEKALVEAEVRIAHAESQLKALLDETSAPAAENGAAPVPLLAERLSLEAQTAQLRDKVLSVEAAVLADGDSERLDPTGLRRRLGEIATDVSRLVYTLDNEPPAEQEESLFERVQRFADDGFKVETIPVRNGAMARAANGAAAVRPAAVGSVADRMAALRELQARR